MNNFGQFVGQIVLIEKKNGRKFTSKLISLDGDWLLFESRDGRRSSERIGEILSISEL